MKEIVDRDLPINREVWSKDDAIAHFRKLGEDYKAQIIDDIIPPGEAITLYRTWRPVERSLPRAAPAVHGQAAQSVQADEAGRRILARRSSQRDAAAHVRHGVGEREGSRRPPDAPRRSREARSPETGPRARSLPHAGRGQGHGVLAREGPDALAHGGKLCAPPSRRSGLYRSAHAAGSGSQVLGTVGPLGEVSRQHVCRRNGGR
jgi:hypothetical protein